MSEGKKTEEKMIAGTVAETKEMLVDMGFTTFPTDERIAELVMVGEKKWREVKEIVLSKEAADKFAKLLNPDQDVEIINHNYLAYACEFAMSLQEVDDIVAQTLIRSTIIQLTMECK